MHFARFVLLITLGGYVTTCRATGEDACPTGPFETDLVKISRELAVLSAQSSSAGNTSGSSGVTGSGRLTDGFFWSGAGGLGAVPGSGAWQSYDAKRYLSVSESTGPGKASEIARTFERSSLGSGIAVRQIDVHLTSTTVTARPTPEQAKEIACLANQLVTPPSAEGAELPHDSGVRLGNSPQEVIVIGRRPPASCQNFTDGHVESFELLTSAPGLRSGGRPCPVLMDLENRLQKAAYEPVKEVIARASGNWKPPHVHSLAVDDMDSLYLLLDPGTLKPSTIEVRRISPAGTVTRLSARTAEQFWGQSFTVDGEGRVIVPANERTASVIYEPTPGGVGDVSSARTPLKLDGLAERYVQIVAIGANADSTLYALSGSRILKISAEGGVTEFAESHVDGHSEPAWARPTLGIAVAADGAIFVADSKRNIIQKVMPDGVVTTVAGTANEMGATDGRGEKARFNSPQGIALDRSGNLYVADSGNHTIRRITCDGRVSTLAGKAGKGGKVDGQAFAARFYSPASIAVDSTGTIYVANGLDNRLRKISAKGLVSTLDVQSYVDAR
jgi:sugar lactone lactonase YvrE